MPFASMNGVNAARGMQGTDRVQSASFNPQQPAQAGAPMGMGPSPDSLPGPAPGVASFGRGNPGVASFGRGSPVENAIRGSSYTHGQGMMAGGQTGSLTNNQNSQAMANGNGVTPGVQTGGPAMAPQATSLESIQQEMARRQVGAQLNANPQNSALSGYMMG